MARFTITMHANAQGGNSKIKAAKQQQQLRQIGALPPRPPAFILLFRVLLLSLSFAFVRSMLFTYFIFSSFCFVSNALLFFFDLSCVLSFACFYCLYLFPSRFVLCFTFISMRFMLPQKALKFCPRFENSWKFMIRAGGMQTKF